MYGNPSDNIALMSLLRQVGRESQEKPNAAVFCDAENASILGEPGVAKQLGSWLEQSFKKTTRFAFADWTRYSDVGEALYTINFDLIHVPDSTRDSTDCVMGSYIVDWLLKSETTDTYVIISSDTIFSPTVQALKKQDKKVILVSNPEITRPESIIRADQYEDIGRFAPVDFSFTILMPPERDKEVLEQYALRRLVETIAKIRDSKKPTFPRYVEVMAKRWHPDVRFGRPGFYGWDETLTSALFNGLLDYDGEGVARRIVLTEKANLMIAGLGDLDSAIERLVTNVGKMYEEGQETSVSVIETKLEVWNIDLEKLGYENISQFLQVVEGRKLLRFDKNEERIVLKPVYTEERVEEWYRKITPDYFGSAANVPPTKYIRKTINLLYNYDLSLTKMEQLLKIRKSRQIHKAILESSDVPFIPPYEQTLLYSLLGLGKDVNSVVDILNTEMKSLGISLKYPDHEVKE